MSEQIPPGISPEEQHEQFLKFYGQATEFVSSAINEKMAAGQVNIPPEIVSMAMVQLGVAAMEDILGTEKTLFALNDLIAHIKAYYENNPKTQS